MTLINYFFTIIFMAFVIGLIFEMQKLLILSVMLGIILTIVFLLIFGIIVFNDELNGDLE